MARVHALRHPHSPRATGARRWVRRTGIVLALLLVAGTAAASHVAAQAAPDATEKGIPAWTLHFGGFRSLQDLAAISPNEAWGIDAIETSLAPGRQPQTAFVHVTEGVWRATRFVEGQKLRALDLSGPSFGLAVGDDGAAWRFDGHDWRDLGPVPEPREDLLAIDLLAPNVGWAVGRRGSILHWDGLRWTHEEPPSGLSRSEIVDVAAVGAQQAWAITHGGRVLRRDGAAWRVDDSAPASRGWQDLAFRTPDHGIVAGRSLVEYRDGAWREIGDPAVLYRSPVWLGDSALLLANDRPVRYRDGAFTPVAFDPGPGGRDLTQRVQRWLKAVSPSEAWAFGSGTTVTRIPDTGRGDWLWPPMDRLETVDALPEPDNRGWAGGEALVHGMVGGNRASAWNTYVTRPAGTLVSDIDLLSATDGWAVGRYTPPSDPLGLEGHMWRWDGEAWQDWPVNKLWRMRRVQMLSESEGWASGDNVVVRWDGESWQQFAGAPPEAAQGDLSIVQGGEDPLGFFGAEGLIFRLADGQWDTWTLAKADLVQAMAAPAADDAWALTRTALYHFDGEGWSDVTPRLGRSRILADIEATAPNDVWLLTEPPGLLRWDGAAWSEHDLAPLGRLSTPFRLRALRLESEGPAADIWLVGEPAMVARYHLSPVLTRINLPWLGR